MKAIDFRWEEQISLPPKVSAKQLPADVDISNATGAYTAHYGMAGDKIAVSRHLVFSQTLYQPKAYPTLFAVIQAADTDFHAELDLSGHP